MKRSGNAAQSAAAVLGQGFKDHGLLRLAHGPLVSGPQAWWQGDLDVERLALGSVGLVCQALDAVSSGTREFSTNSAQIAAAFGSMNQLRVEGATLRGFAAHSGFFRSADGWIRTHANYPHHELALETALGISSGKTIEGELARLAGQEAQELIVAAGGVAAAVQTRQQWLASEAGVAARHGEWAQFDIHESAAAKTWDYDPHASQPLRGLKVLDLTRVIAGPTASRVLAAFGAQVLRVDPPHMPELLGQHIDTGFGKRSTLLDLRRGSGLERIHELLKEADALILGYRPGALEPAGLGVEELQERYPDLAIARLCAWGFDGPWSARRGFDSIVQAATGIADCYRDEKQRPGALPVQALDHATGYGLAAAIICLVHARSRSLRTGVASFSLARTAEALFSLGKPAQPVQPLKSFPLRRQQSAFGELDYVPPPFTVDGHSMDYGGPPPPYGQDRAAWL